MKVTYVVVSPLYMVLGVPVAQLVDALTCDHNIIGSNHLTSMGLVPQLLEMYRSEELNLNFGIFILMCTPQ